MIVFQAETLGEWQAGEASGLLTANDSGSVILNDGQSLLNHVFNYTNQDASMRLVTLIILYRPLKDCDADLCISQAGVGALAFFNRDLHCRATRYSEGASINLAKDGYIEARAKFVSRGPVISLSTSKGALAYQAAGTDQYEICSLHITVETCDDWFNKVPEAEKVVLADVGAAFGLQPCWRQRINQVVPILFEPNPAEALKLDEQIKRIPGGRVVQAALSNASGVRSLNVAHFPGCTSLLKPNMELLKNYRIGRLFATIKTLEVQCSRYDSLVALGLCPAPDAIKLDVQGFEWEVLDGCGGLLDECLGVELETHVYPIYHDQKLLGDVIKLVESHGLMLQKLEGVDHFQGDLIEFNAWFTPGPQRLTMLSPVQKRKLQFIREAWGLT
jgi:FkbM family methyltransferase